MHSTDWLGRRCTSALHTLSSKYVLAEFDRQHDGAVVPKLGEVNCWEVGLLWSALSKTLCTALTCIVCCHAGSAKQHEEACAAVLS